MLVLVLWSSGSSGQGYVCTYEDTVGAGQTLGMMSGGGGGGGGGGAAAAAAAAARRRRRGGGACLIVIRVKQELNFK